MLSVLVTIAPVEVVNFRLAWPSAGVAGIKKPIELVVTKYIGVGRVWPWLSVMSRLTPPSVVGQGLVDATTREGEMPVASPNTIISGARGTPNAKLAEFLLE